MMKELYDEDYFLRGKESGKSLYENYHWMPDLTIPMVRDMIRYLGIRQNESILDFGCARGYLVKAFRELHYDAWGIDSSEWAIANCDPEVAQWCNRKYTGPADWIIAKDVLEHIPQVADTITELIESASKGVFVVVPLSAVDGQLYVVRSYEKDITHIHRLTLASWCRFFMRPGWEITASYRVKGIKDNYAEWQDGNGFITARRI